MALAHEIKSRKIGVRTLARGMAGEGADARTIESARRKLLRYIYDGVRPNEANRQAVADALGVARDDLPVDEDDEESDMVGVTVHLPLALFERVVEAKLRELAKGPVA